MNASPHKWTPRDRSPGLASRRGFTLIELLVSTALVLLIMSLFAQVFQIAAGTLHTQRGIAENDQRVRSLTTTLNSDLKKRTFRQRQDLVTETNRGQFADLLNFANSNSLGITPLHPDYVIGGEAGNAGVTRGSKRDVDPDQEQGYFYISEGDPARDDDDVLQFTVNANQIDLGEEDTTPFAGRARRLGQPGDALMGSTIDPSPNGTGVNINQPLWDDGIGFLVDTNDDAVTFGPFETGTTQSPYAEISYFLRRGVLYRRVILIRDKPDATLQPTDQFGAPFIDAVYDAEDLSPPDPANPPPNGPSDWYGDFDMSATQADVNRQTALADPRNRFGHDPSPWPNNGLQGRPKEYIFASSLGRLVFIGRYTQEETSHPLFLYPGQFYDPNFMATSPPRRFSPLSFDIESAGAPASFDDANNDQRVDGFEDGPRRGEDILLTNVHGFDIKVWDDVVGAFVDVGHSLTPDPPVAGGGSRGDWHISRVTVNSNITPPDAIPGSHSDNGPWGTATDGDPDRFHSGPRTNAGPPNGMGQYGGLNVPAGFAQINRIFDTWYPQFNFTAEVPGPAIPEDDVPPFRPQWSDRDNFAAVKAALVNPVLSNLGIPAPPAARQVPNYWQPRTVYPPGSIVFPRPKLLPNGQPAPGHQSFFYIAVPFDGPRRILDASPMYLSANYGAGADGQPGVGGMDDDSNNGFDDFWELGFGGVDVIPQEPVWPQVAGQTVSDGVSADADVNAANPDGNGLLDILPVTWMAVPNTIGLKAIQISVRFYDPTSGQMRQLSLLHSFVEQ